MSTKWYGIVMIVGALAWSAPVDAKDRSQGKQNDHDKGKVERSEKAEPHQAKPEKHEDAGTRIVGTRGVAKPRKPARPIAEPVVVIDRDGHRRIVTEYFSRESLPPGLAKRQSLPPGLQKQLRERGHLPPGLQKRLVPVPSPLASRLPVVPPYYDRYFAGRDLIVVDRRTNSIVAIIPDVPVPRR